MSERRCSASKPVSHEPDAPPAGEGGREGEHEDEPWYELIFECESADANALCASLEDALSEAGGEAPASLTIEDARSDRPELPDASDPLEPLSGEMPLWPQVRVRALYRDPIDLQALKVRLPGATGLRRRVLCDRDWQASALEAIHPIEIGDLWIGPERLAPPSSARTGRKVVFLSPGLAFGSGRHPTTRLCLERLVANPPCDQDVLDYGCGSGILAIVAAMLGAKRVFAFDIEPQALEATRRNARLNRVSDRIRTISDPKAIEALPCASFSLILANILARTLVDLAPGIGRLTAPEGEIALSGILADQSDMVIAAYERDFDSRLAATSDGWSLIEGRRRRG
ncbi:50S ribosomal protein L11 methyltransferase [Thioalkalivibrio sp. HK1]|uniref:50S ribosomal protein L11 methyltransferase n=1 Tax=Thioalkalivibrio sp. HK1 TaxID=1469245 RepID=UPI000471DA04|nr:50S ribosomal protein L11 methyltransferase [Thioalkalivibrio sp. HK1]